MTSIEYAYLAMDIWQDTIRRWISGCLHKQKPKLTPGSGQVLFGVVGAKSKIHNQRKEQHARYPGTQSGDGYLAVCSNDNNKQHQVMCCLVLFGQTARYVWCKEQINNRWQQNNRTQHTRVNVNRKHIEKSKKRLFLRFLKDESRLNHVKSPIYNQPLHIICSHYTLICNHITIFHRPK